MTKYSGKESRTPELVIIQTSDVDEDAVGYEIWTSGGLRHGRMLATVSWANGGASDDGHLTMAGGAKCSFSDFRAALAEIARHHEQDVPAPDRGPGRG